MSAQVVYYNFEQPNYLVHHGIRGQKWGIRRFQNDDGSVTPAGAERYYVGGKGVAGSKGGETKVGKKSKPDSTGKVDSAQKKGMSQNTKKALKIAGGVAAAAAVTAGAVLAAKYLKNQKLAAQKVAEIAERNARREAEAYYKMYQDIDVSKLASPTKSYINPQLAREMERLGFGVTDIVSAGFERK